jgi:hypothetical protein
VSDDESGSGPEEEGEGAEGGATDTGSLSTPRARAPWERKDPNDEVKHSALVGFMSVPVARRFPLRRSTLVMAVAFIGLATLLYFNPPQSSTNTGSGVVLHTPQGDVFVPNAAPVNTTTTTTTAPPPTTTTTDVRSPTTTTFSTTPSTSPSTSTTTTTTLPGGGSAATTTTSGGPTGTNGFGGTTTTSVPR